MSQIDYAERLQQHQTKHLLLKKCFQKIYVQSLAKKHLRVAILSCQQNHNQCKFLKCFENRQNVFLPIRVSRHSAFRSREKEELISRLARNPETANVFKTTTNIRKFSTNSLRGDLPNGIMDHQPSRISTRISQSLQGGILPPQVRSSISSGRSRRGSQSGSYLVVRGSNLSSHPDLNEGASPKGSIEDTVKLRFVIENIKYIVPKEFSHKWCITLKLGKTSDQANQ